MMRRIEAEERLAAINDRALAAGNMKRPAAHRHQAALERAARSGDRPKAAKMNPGALASMGIAVRTFSKPSEKGSSDG